MAALQLPGSHCVSLRLAPHSGNRTSILSNRRIQDDSQQTLLSCKRNQLTCMEEPPKPGWLERVSTLLLREPGDREQLVALLHSAFERNLFDSDALSMIEGVIQVSEMQARDIMIPRSQMDVIDISETPDKFIPFVIEKAHSRFPVTENDRNNVIGILLAKDLLRFYAGEEEFDVREMLRPVVFIPESKRLNVLLKDFRSNRNHIAIVVDEYGGVAGLVTIEDVLEQIVGDIEDEHDFDEIDDNIVQEPGGHCRIKAVTEIADFNEKLGSSLSDEDYDTIGGLVLHSFGRLPKRGESVVVGPFKFTVLRADSRRLYTLQVEPNMEETPVEPDLKQEE
jgi:magnesium and cobalt transporter